VCVCVCVCAWDLRKTDAPRVGPSDRSIDAPCQMMRIRDATLITGENNTGGKRKTLLRYKVNNYGDAVIVPSSIPDDEERFRTALSSLLETSKRCNRSAVWLKLTPDKAMLIPLAHRMGFVAHHATEENYMLVRWLSETRNSLMEAPYASHALRVSCLVLTRDERSGRMLVLMVREKG
jgi:hypothetical protein